MAYSEKDSWLCSVCCAVFVARECEISRLSWDTHGVTLHSAQTLISLASVLCLCPLPAFFITIRQLLHPWPPLTGLWLRQQRRSRCYGPSHISFSEPGQSRRRVSQVTTDSRGVKAADSGAQ